MSSRHCCLLTCKNSGANSDCKFYTFPVTKYKQQQREKWIQFVMKVNGPLWKPKVHTVICSHHFFGKTKSNEEISPSYVPTIISPSKSGVIHETTAINRHTRFMNRRFSRVLEEKNERKRDLKNSEINLEIHNDVLCDNTNMTMQCDSMEFLDKECQVEFSDNDSSEEEKTFTCNSYINNNHHNHRDVEIQTDIVINECKKQNIVVLKTKNKSCGTPQKTFQDVGVGTDTVNEKSNTAYFCGISSIKKSEQLLDLTGVSMTNFEFLLKRIDDPGDNSKFSKENKLLIFLMKMKIGLTFAALSVLFCVHRTTISRIFISVLKQVRSATANLVFWPSREVVQGTMPQCFFPDYSNTRVIIDCTEFRIEVPASIDNRVYTYSHYKKGFTAKVLIGITPSGFISLKSKVAGGRKSDCQMTIESGLIDLLEDGDIILADKGFPDIRRIIDETGKKVVLVMPPFLEKKSEFTKAETVETYNIAKVRIHVERIMQRLRTYQILNKIPENLFRYIDDIVHICCALVNLQPPIIIPVNTDKSIKE